MFTGWRLIVKMSILPQLISSFKAIIIKIPLFSFEREIDKLILKSLGNYKEPRIVKATLKNNKNWRTIL